MSNADGFPHQHPHFHTDPSLSTQASPPDLLRRVLEETLARGQSGMSEVEWSAIQAVARTHKHMQHELPMEHIVQILLETVLSARFPQLSNAAFRRNMCQQLSSSLCEDPVSMQRMRVFWKQLRESIR